MKARALCLLLLSACTESDVSYQYALTWTCQSLEGCERTEELKLIDRLNLSGDFFFFISRRDTSFDVSAQRVDSDSLPAGCALLYGFAIFGHELDPSKVCSSANGLVMEFSIPNAIPTTHSQWLVEARDLGPW